MGNGKWLCYGKWKTPYKFDPEPEMCKFQEKEFDNLKKFSDDKTPNFAPFVFLWIKSIKERVYIYIFLSEKNFNELELNKKYSLIFRF